MRKLIKIEQVDNNRKYDFVIFGNCIDPLHKKLRVSQLCNFSVPSLYYRPLENVCNPRIYTDGRECCSPTIVPFPLLNGVYTAFDKNTEYIVYIV